MCPGAEKFVDQVQMVFSSVKDSTTLALTLETLLDDLDLCERLGQQGRKIVDSEF